MSGRTTLTGDGLCGAVRCDIHHPGSRGAASSAVAGSANPPSLRFNHYAQKMAAH
ncbi:hypothetical protein [Teichococcus oryzae]|uniref:hypothetical protein n=1 Tax=Teichococcus oryzae TaxID=1608942 RepID=UPI001376299E|nr:hypothetical protein [Pseudoroseomonas oryzae]